MDNAFKGHSAKIRLGKNWGFIPVQGQIILFENKCVNKCS